MIRKPARGIRLVKGDCREILPTWKDNTFDAIVTDPPAGIAFMGKEWDSFAGKPFKHSERQLKEQAEEYGRNTPLFGCAAHPAAGRKGEREAFIAFLSGVFREAMRVLKPAHYALVWALPRTSHWTATALEDAGFEIRDVIHHLFGCLSDDTEVLTDNGWERYQNIAEGRPVVAYNVDTGTIQWEQVQEVYVYPYSETAYAIRSESTDQIVSRNHRCVVWDGTQYRFVLAEEAARQHEVCVPVVEDVHGLFASISGIQSLSSSEKQDVLSGVSQQYSEGSKLRKETAGPSLPALRQSVSTEGEAGKGTFQVPLLQHCLCGQGESCRSSIPGSPQGDWRDRQGRLDTGVSGVISRQDEWSKQSGMEGRCDNIQDARQLQGSTICPLSPGFPADGAEGWLCNGTQAFGSTGHWALADANGSGSSRGSQPNEQRTIEPVAFLQQSGSQIARGTRYTRPDLARITPIYYEGKVWCIRVPSGAFIARRSGKVFITGNSGFPKGNGSLKPAAEHWILCRKPGKGVRELGIDECRVPGLVPQVTQGVTRRASSGDAIYGAGYDIRRAPQESNPSPLGRWPANVAHDGSEEVLEAFAAFGEKIHSAGDAVGKGVLAHSSIDDGVIYRKGIGESAYRYGDTGTPARFFYAAKASKADRGEGNSHPTVKNTALMEWLIKLICPPKGVVLDPFMGSGSTGVAAINTRRKFVGIEREEEYFAIAEKRINQAIQVALGTFSGSMYKEKS